MVESQLATANDRLLELEQSKAVVESVSSERLSEITELQRRLEGNVVREDLLGEVEGQRASLEKQVVHLQEEVRASNDRERERSLYYCATILGRVHLTMCVHVYIVFLE